MKFLILIPLWLSMAAVPASALPAPDCQAASLQTYLELGADGCHLGALHLSNFDYSGHTTSSSIDLSASSVLASPGPSDLFISSAGRNSFFLEFDVVDDEWPFIFGNVLKLGIVGWGTPPFVRRAALNGFFTPGPDLFVVNCLPSTHLAIGFGCAPPPLRGPIFKNEDASSFSGVSAQHVVLSAPSALGIGGVGIRSFTVGFVPEPSVLVPEPSVLLLLGAGAGGLAFATRRSGR